MTGLEMLQATARLLETTVQRVDALTAEIKELRLWQAREEQRVMSPPKYVSNIFQEEDFFPTTRAGLSWKTNQTDHVHTIDPVDSPLAWMNDPLKTYTKADFWWQQELEACKPMIQHLYHFHIERGGGRELHARLWAPSMGGALSRLMTDDPVWCQDVFDYPEEDMRYPASHDPIIFSES